ncbi:iron complex transport system substrate-binding protein [Alkalispirochaeta americana]|uniref:Iron complex transport system substrate-binding protein n=1 Tax=Alkalispirochaeta americana TaxID=159291 RepID=A0A1N6TMI0_9SPIO|nr:ABC transporter substrate-binding protein [Alkalispirochaeta americana]SIQ54454.1 iron complex transport system substrate-binding protein [Alkalispirochaeta americana]
MKRFSPSISRRTRFGSSRPALVATMWFLAGIMTFPELIPGQLQAAETGYSRTVTDALGRQVTLEAPPQRIVTAGRAMIMTAGVLWAFPGVPDRTVGLGRNTQGPANFLEVTHPRYNEITQLERTVGAEQVAALRPDLVILKSGVRENLGRPLERLGFPVIYVDLETPEQYYRELLMLGETLDQEERGRELARFFRETARAVTDTTTTIPREERPTTLLIYYRRSGGQISFNVPPAGWLQTSLVEMAGGIPLWLEANPGGGWSTVSFEQIAAWNPETIILVDYGGEAPALRDDLASHPRWRQLQAVRDNRFYAMPRDYYSWDQPDVRWLLGLQWLARTFHPRAFSQTPLEGQIRQFFSTLYRIEGDSFERLIAPVLTGDLP